MSLTVRIPRTRHRGASIAAAVASSAAMVVALATPGIASPTSAPGRDDDVVHAVTARIPVSGPATAATTELGADRSYAAITRDDAPRIVAADANPWKELATVPGVVKDIDFATKKVGYAAAELGVIWKTVDGGKTWEQVVNVGFPLYFYGVQALSKDEVVVSGFDNQASPMAGVVWRSYDGGATWATDVTVEPGWAGRVRFADDDHGLMAGLVGSATWNTSNGGETSDDWAYAMADPAGGWIGSQFTLLRSMRAYLSGIAYCESTTGGAEWTCGPSIDEVFDGPASFRNKKFGWVGGGTISPDVTGWLHRTTDGGATWSDRVLQTAWPVRHIESITRDKVWAVGGNTYSAVGGIYFSADGGATWSLDLDTGNEVTSCTQHRAGKAKKKVWCTGFVLDGSWKSTFYSVKVPKA